MALDRSTKKAIDLTAPVLLTGIAVFYSMKRTKDWRYLVAIGLISFIILYVLITQATKLLITVAERPDHVNVPPDASGGIDSAFDASPWVENLHDDLYKSWFSAFTRNTSLYENMSKLSNANLVKIYNLWNDRYFDEEKETIVAAIDRDYFYGAAFNYAKNVNDRLKGMGLQ